MAAALTISDETITGSPDCEDAKKDDILLMATLETGAEETTMQERATDSCCWFAWLSWWQGQQLGTLNKLYNLTQLELTTHAIQETSYVTLRRMIPWPPMTSIGLIFT